MGVFGWLENKDRRKIWEKEEEEEDVGQQDFFRGWRGGIFGIFLVLFWRGWKSVQRKLNFDNQKKLLLP